MGRESHSRHMAISRPELITQRTRWMEALHRQLNGTGGSEVVSVSVTMLP
jgi:hypothetical protein